MLEMRVSEVVETCVKQFLLDTESKETTALYFHFDCRLSNYVKSNRQEFKASRGLHLVYHRKPRLASVSVFSWVSNSPFAKIDAVGENVEEVAWKHETTHDSCWRGLSVYSDVYFRMANDINWARVSVGLEEIAPASMDQNVSFSLFSGRVFKEINVEVTKDKEDSSGYNYRRILKVLP